MLHCPGKVMKGELTMAHNLRSAFGYRLAALAGGVDIAFSECAC